MKIINDAAMQALGSYTGGCRLFLGLGTGVGSALITDNVILPLELGELPYKGSRSLLEYLGRSALRRSARSGGGARCPGRRELFSKPSMRTTSSSAAATRRSSRTFRQEFASGTIGVRFAVAIVLTLRLKAPSVASDGSVAFAPWSSAPALH